jgi:hypothetical protein
MPKEQTPHAFRLPRPTAFGTTSVADLGHLAEEPERVIHPPFRIPEWLLEMHRNKESDVDIAATLERRVLAGETDLRETQRVLNDIGRRPGGAAVLLQFVTQDVVSRLGGRR